MTGLSLVAGFMALCNRIRSGFWSGQLAKLAVDVTQGWIGSLDSSRGLALIERFGVFRGAPYGDSAPVVLCVLEDRIPAKEGLFRVSLRVRNRCGEVLGAVASARIGATPQLTSSASEHSARQEESVD